MAWATSTLPDSGLLGRWMWACAGLAAPRLPARAGRGMSAPSRSTTLMVTSRRASTAPKRRMLRGFIGTSFFGITKWRNVPNAALESRRERVTAPAVQTVLYCSLGREADEELRLRYRPQPQGQTIE